MVDFLNSAWVQVLIFLFLVIYSHVIVDIGKGASSPSDGVAILFVNFSIFTFSISLTYWSVNSVNFLNVFWATIGFLTMYVIVGLLVGAIRAFLIVRKESLEVTKQWVLFRQKLDLFEHQLKSLLENKTKEELTQGTEITLEEHAPSYTKQNTKFLSAYFDSHVYNFYDILCKGTHRVKYLNSSGAICFYKSSGNCNDITSMFLRLRENPLMVTLSKERVIGFVLTNGWTWAFTIVDFVLFRVWEQIAKRLTRLLETYWRSLFKNVEGIRLDKFE